MRFPGKFVTQMLAYHQVARSATSARVASARWSGDVSSLSRAIVVTGWPNQPSDKRSLRKSRVAWKRSAHIRRSVVLACLASLCAAVIAPCARAELQPNGVPGNWHLVYNEQFNLAGLNTAIWTPGWHHTGISGPMSGQCVNSANVEQPGNGYLYLYLKNVESTCEGTKVAYTGALVESDPADKISGHVGFSYSYGYVEWRVYIPGVGASGCPKGGCLPDWPAVWSLGVTNSDEIDAMEGLGSLGQACYHVHPPAGSEGPGGCQPGSDSYAGWHTYGALWEPGVATYYYDGKEVGHVVSSSLKPSPQYLIMDMVPPGCCGGPLAIPDSMLIEYVRVWQHPSSPSAVYDPSAGRNVFYKEPNGSLAVWYVQNGSWKDVELVQASDSTTNETLAVGSSPTSVDEPHGTGRNAYYVGGSGDKIWSWGVNGSHWENAELAAASDGAANESAVQGSNPSAVYEPTGSGRNVFYVGANSKIWDWWVNGNHWENPELAAASGGGANESAASGGSPSAVYVPSGDGRSNVFYVGANGKIWDWWINGNHWEDLELAAASGGGANESATSCSSPSAVYEPVGSGCNVFYVGANGKVWDWWVNGNHWEDTELATASGGGANESAGSEASPSAVYEPTGSDRSNVFYVGANGKVWDWWINGSHWEDLELAAASGGGANASAQEYTVPSAVYEPSGTGTNVFYFSNGQIWEWLVNGNHWENAGL